LISFKLTFVVEVEDYLLWQLRDDEVSWLLQRVHNS